MGMARAWSVALIGMEATPVEVEVHLGAGLPRTVLVGLPDASLHESRERCRAALASAGWGWPSQPVTINLSPAMLPKAGSHYDLSIVAAVAVARGLCPGDLLERYALMGELGLDGRVRPVRGLLAAALGAARTGFETVVVPASQVAEAALVEGIAVRGVADLGDLLEVLRGGAGHQGSPREALAVPDSSDPDLRDVVGQVEGRWALEVAAAGRHHLFLQGPPGVGKTLLVERLPGILPDLEPEESLEVSAIHSLFGPGLAAGLVLRPPYADPHHSASVASLVGGGARIAVPGAASRAHRGVLFLDEAPEFSPRAMEALRVPLESGRVVLGRSMATAVYPARFQLVLAANPCPCGQAATPGGECQCQPMTVRRYRDRISGPVLDRIDLHQQLRPVRRSFLVEALQQAESSKQVRARVAEARRRQARRLSRLPWRCNGEVPGAELRRQLPSPQRLDLLEEAVSRGTLSARGVDKVIRVSWTLADLAGLDRPGPDQVATALAMRRGEPTPNVGRSHDGR